MAFYHSAVQLRSIELFICVSTFLPWKWALGPLCCEMSSALGFLSAYTGKLYWPKPWTRGGMKALAVAVGVLDLFLVNLNNNSGLWAEKGRTEASGPMTVK